jgi:hypothetical protein
MLCPTIRLIGFDSSGCEMSKLGCLVAMVVAFLPTGAWAQTSAEYAAMGKKAFAAFECAALASGAGDADEQKRLFTLGYEQGKTFIEAARSGKIEKQDLDQVPIGMLVDGPTADFVLGREWEFDIEYYQRNAYVSEANPNADVASAMRYAKGEFANKNCDLM